MLTLNLIDDSEVILFPFQDDANDDYYYLKVSEDEQPYLEIELINDSFIIRHKNSNVQDEDDFIELKLDELYLKIIEQKQSGVEGSEYDEIAENPYDPDKIRVDTKTFSLRQIYDMIEHEDIDLSPDFQRNFVWDNTRQSRLIESILLRIPLPMFYFSQSDDGLITVVDGLQRLTTIKNFMDNKLRLKNLEYLDSCDGKYYDKGNSIDAKFYRYFNMTQIVVNVIDPQSPAKVKYDIFRRINTGGKPLNWQEIRNCLSKAHTRSLLNAMVQLESFREATSGSIKETRMEAQELALRFIVFYDLFTYSNISEYSGSMVSTLDAKIEELNSLDTQRVEPYIEKFNNALINSYYLFGRYAFRKCKVEHIQPGARTQLINKALFISWTVILSEFDPQYIEDNYQRGSLAMSLATEISNDNDFFKMLTYGTNNKLNVINTFSRVMQVFRNNSN